MKIEIDMKEKEQMALITFFTDEFKAPRDYVVALSFVYSVAADFELGPELESEDLEELIKQFRDDKKDKFVFEISEDGIEINLG